jgi:hypothetical protein
MDNSLNTMKRPKITERKYPMQILFQVIIMEVTDVRSVQSMVQTAIPGMFR